MLAVFWVGQRAPIPQSGLPCPTRIGNELFTLKMKAAGSSETFVSYRNIVWYNNPEDLHLNFTAVKASNLATSSNVV
jgi:hypothetical protein